MDEPTRGIDVGTKAEIYRLIRGLAAGGTTVVAVSSELPELIGMSDRVLIMHEGRVSGEVPPPRRTRKYCWRTATERLIHMTTTRNPGTGGHQRRRAVPRRSVADASVVRHGARPRRADHLLLRDRPDVFLSFGNVRNILSQVAILAIIAGAQTIVMVVGDFDLSVAATSTSPARWRPP